MALQADKCGQRIGARMLKLAAEDAATVGTFSTSVAGLEEEIELQAQQFEQERTELVAIHAGEVARLEHMLAQVCARLAASEELSSERARDVEAHRRMVRTQAEEDLQARRAMRQTLTSEGDVRLCVLASAVASLEQDLVSQRERFEREAQARDDASRSAAVRASLDHKQDMLGLQWRMAGLGVASKAEVREQRLAFEQALSDRDAAHARYVDEIRAENTRALSRQEIALREEVDWHRERHEAQSKDMDIQQEKMREIELAHARAQAELHDRLAEHSGALAMAREALELQRVEAERFTTESRRDAQLRTRIDRSRCIYRLETGLEPVPWPLS